MTIIQNNTNINRDQKEQIIIIEDLIPQLGYKDYCFSSVPKNISSMRNGINYYYVEIQCEGEKFIIHAYGKEAEQLFKAVQYKIYKTKLCVLLQAVDEY